MEQQADSGSPTPDAVPGAAPVSALAALIRARIAAAGGRISFAEYMDLALYHPEYGYYSAGVVNLGRGGDFVTSPEVDPAFGAALAVLVQRCDAALDRPRPFLLAEHGAGSGRLLRDVLYALAATDPDLYGRLAPVIVERSPALRARQQALLEASPHAARVAWAAEARGSGLIFSNELLDAFPVHRVIGTAAGLDELFVTVDARGRLAAAPGPLSDPALAGYFARLGVTLAPGQMAEVNLAAPAWLRAVATDLVRGFVLTIDYGDSAARLYGPLRPDGTLLCYSSGRVTDDPFAAPGAQDMTAHVDFTTLEQVGREAGLTTVTATRQMDFLVALGLGARIAALSATPVPDRDAQQAVLAQRGRLFRLIDPDGLGRFHVLLQAKGLPAGRAATVVPRIG